jgi:DNA-binding CsgD family transcriptional regulator
MLGMQKACRNNMVECTLITTVDQMHVVDEKLNASNYNDVFIFSFERKNIIDYILKIDERRVCKFIIIINTPVNAPGINIGNWLVISKSNSLVEIERAVATHITYQPSFRRFHFTAREEYIWLLLKRGKTVCEIAHSLKLSTVIVSDERKAIIRKIWFQRESEFLYLKFGHIYND